MEFSGFNASFKLMSLKMFLCLQSIQHLYWATFILGNRWFNTGVSWFLLMVQRRLTLSLYWFNWVYNSGLQLVLSAKTILL